MTLAETLLLSRRRLGLSQTELAKMAGVSRNTISALENGDLHVRIGTILDVFGAIGVTVTFSLVAKKSDES